jgi:membrane protein required for colicin V production
MQAVDIVVAIVLVTFALRGYLRGLFSEITSLMALVIALAAAFRWTPDFVPRWADSIPGPPMADTGITFLFLFGALGLALRMIFGFVRRAWSPEGSSAFDRLGGAAFGLCKGAVVLGCAVLLLRTFTPVPASAKAPAEGGGPLVDLNSRLARSLVASRLAEVSSELFSTFADAAEIRLRMLAASDNESR